MGAYTIAKNVNADGSISIILGGSLSIENCGELHKTVSDSLDESQQIVLNPRMLESIDLTCMQVICSGCKTAAAMGRGYDCEPGAMPDSMISFGGGMGGPKGLPCSQNYNRPCIWYGGIQ